MTDARDDQEQHERDQEEVDDGAEEVADLEVQRRHRPVAPFAVALDGADERHHDVGDQRADDLAEGAADDDGDGEVDDVALERERFEVGNEPHGAHDISGA